MNYLSPKRLADLGLASCGRDVKISTRCVIHGAEHIHVGDHVRIDDFSILTAREPMRIGCHVHIGCHTFLSGPYGIDLQDFSGISPYVALFSGSDDFSGTWLTGPTISDSYRRITSGRIVLQRHVIVGVHCSVLPGVTVGEGSVVGAHSLVTKSLPPWGVYVGVPARLLRPRNKNLLELERRLLRSESSGHAPYLS